jgi:hypothetical protein
VRYYRISFTNPKTGKGLSAGNKDFPDVFSSHSETGVYNPGALEVEFEIANGWGHMLAAQTHIRIHNPTLQMVEKSIQYNGSVCVIEAGFRAGLPLANPNQSGIIGSGIVQNTYANWLGTDLVLDFLLYPSTEFGDVNLNKSANTGVGSPVPINLVWEKGSLKDAIQASVAPFGIKVTGIIRESLNNPPAPIKSWYSNYQSFATAIQKISQTIVDPASFQSQGTQGNPQSTGVGQWQSYYGVMMQWIPNTKEIQLIDGTLPSGAIELSYAEFVGQPTWLSDSGMLQSVHPMRSDISLGFNVRYPKNLPTQANPSQITIRNQLVTPGGSELWVMGVRHSGRFRDTSATGWVTYIDAARPYRFNPNKEPDGEVTVEPLIQEPF